MGHVHEHAHSNELLIMEAWADLHQALKSARNLVQAEIKTLRELEVLADTLFQQLLREHQDLELELDSVLPAQAPPAEDQQQ